MGEGADRDVESLDMGVKSVQHTHDSHTFTLPGVRRVHRRGGERLRRAALASEDAGSSQTGADKNGVEGVREKTVTP
ncbi:hypothetical protein AA23498_2847 [Acetobacter nitrogenifigens DSM 23921 = NBRC 105050]|uniref:Uncharacterized protein n=1 Tax=Acetobacter nitrogenifigens DSM 23921 = NBRC 105050 TaxID=1120919 RepID=A0A511XDG5_9PROT|nr:hypothetical protein AA23498_2847 [Acetobacter nitrogenifigens DSM 23921 = NBRC 105050]GEN60999.1 hypothetical protein ANI02nite_28830 [Acetobacter nitrogenifigens DSM 23921 = NBRC 105050]